MGANAKKIKSRIKSIQSTMHITKAMELVASSKLKKATLQMENNRPYAQALEEIFSSLSNCKSPYTTERENGKRLYIVIAGDRGLAGGYNNDVYKLLNRIIDKDSIVYPIGKKAVEYVSKRGYEILDSFPSVERITPYLCMTIGKQLATAFKNGNFREIHLIYTKHETILTRTTLLDRLLPLQRNEETQAKKGNYIFFEPNQEIVLDGAIPEYLSGRIYGAICESFSAELAARRTAMDSASKNAGTMIDSLNLQYNRVRQGAITQELTEIIGGTMK